MASIIEDSGLDQQINRIANATQTKPAIPAGYISMELSTQGLVGAPTLFHTRNFDTTDLMNLALSEDEDLPEKVASMLDNLILEPDVSVLNFHEKEVIEYLVRLYKSFYANTLKDIDFPWNDSDLEYLKKQYGGDTADYQARLADLKQGREKPKTDIDLSTVETYDLDPTTFKTNMKLTSKSSGFKVGFSFPRYGDVVILRNFITQEYKQRDKEFAALKDILKFREDAKKRIRDGENISFNRIPNIPDTERERFKEYETEKALFTMTAIKALHLINFDGVDVSEMPLKDRLVLARDPRLDYNISKAMDEFYKTLHIGLKEQVSMRNSLKGVVELRDYSFRLVDIFQAAKLHQSTEYDIDFE